MKKYNAQLASLVLFSALCVSGMTIGMEKELPELPSDVKTIIANNVLRLILDEAEDNPAMLFEEQWRWPKNVTEMITSFSVTQEKGSMVDMIILLIENGADPNTKNYIGNTVLHLLIKGIPERYWIKEPGGTAQGYVWHELRPKIKQLLIHKVNPYVKDAAGNTIAHTVAMQLANEYRNYAYTTEKHLSLAHFSGELFLVLAHLGLNLNRIKNKDGYTPCQLGQKVIQDHHFASDFNRQEALRYLERSCKKKD